MGDRDLPLPTIWMSRRSWPMALCQAANHRTKLRRTAFFFYLLLKGIGSERSLKAMVAPTPC
jgi:hypothetical protein